MWLTWRSVVAVVAGFPLVLWWPVPATVLAWVGFVAILVAFDLAVAVSPRRLVLRREQPDPVRSGEPSRSRVRVGNESGRTAQLAVRDAWQPSAGAAANRHRIRVAPGEQAVVETPLLPSRRGERHADRLTVRSFGPLRLGARQTSFDCPATLRVLPAFPSRRHLPSRLARLQQIEGQAVVRHRGQGTEFDSLREYVAGDDVRAVDWRATARGRRLVVRTWRPERDRRIMLVLDTSRVSAGRVGDTPRLDSAMDAALLIGALAARAGDLVGLIAGDRRVRAQLAPTRHDVLASLSGALAGLEPALVEADWGMLASALARQGRRMSLVVLLTPMEPAAVGETLLPTVAALARRHRVVVASVADPTLADLTARRDTVSASYVAAAAERASTEREQVARALEQVGVTVLDAPPELLPVRLTDHYLALKSRGLL